MAKAVSMRRWREVRNRFLANLGLSLATVMATILRVAEFNDWVIPTAVIAITLVVIWAGEDYFDEHSEHLILSSTVLLQMFLYWPHFGAVVSMVVAAGGLAFIWRSSIAALWRQHRRPVMRGVEVPDEVRGSMRGAVKDVAKTVQTVQKKVNGAPRTRK